VGHTRSSKKGLIKRVRKGMVHKTNCTEGYFKASKSFTQIHHIVCISSMTNATIATEVQDKGQTEFVRECLKLTNWDINAKPNVVGLPLKRAFVHKGAPGGWDGWPCHQWEHPAYTDKVSTKLNDNVWQKVLKKRKKCTDCGTKCNINAASVQKELNDESKDWLRFLRERGNGTDSGQKGTAACWKGRKNNVNWYIPFSMNPDGATFRNAPPDWDGTGSLTKYCSDVMFSLI
jgi:hypothetical protein